MNSSRPQKRVGVLGLGKMGSGFASNLLTRGYEVHVYNRSAEKTRPLVAKGAIAHLNPQELAQKVDVTITSLTDQDAVREVALGKNGFLKSLKKGSLWIDMSTIDPDASKGHAGEAASLGIDRLDAPVVASPAMAAEGKAILLVGGDRRLFGKYEDFLKDLGNAVYLGEAGAGHKMKLAINLYLGLVAESFAEAMVFSQKLGFEARTFVDTVNKTAHRNYFTEGKGPNIAAGKFEATFTLNNLVKDLRLADDQARKNRMALPLSSVVTALSAGAVNLGYGEKDYTAIALEIQRLNGISSQTPT